ncbi:L,D-transpeptidase [Pseudoruegeria sp. SK021]|uniref:L,D-transpeptidase n=1 Tax=Pseudoruegeria sp. SK021 TaxID=1933035 RepID=UPI000A21D5E2|nr:L,D-transpeptidase [Pseudoruegeria sp. SK021]OSP55181.1 L,D-transpeptidase [Pseudoruegeria sp. SK021]
MSMKFSRRGVLAGGAASLALSSTKIWAQAAPVVAPDSMEEAATRRNIGGFRAQRWEDHFDDLSTSVIVADTTSRTLHFWQKGGGTPPLVFPTSVPISPELTRLGYTEVTQKVNGPSWRPTPSMRERNPDWPAVVLPGPDNPLGSHALYLSWQYYRIHGTHDTRKIGRPSSDGCIGLYNEQIAQLFEVAEVGTRVRLI